MAVLDGLLDVVIRKDLHGLQLIPGRPLRLRRCGKSTEVGTRQLEAGKILDLLREVGPDGGPPDVEVGSRWKFIYRRRGIDFEFSAALTPEGWSVTCSPRVRSLRKSARATQLNGAVLEPERLAIATALDGATQEAALADTLGRREFPRIPMRIEIEFTIESLAFVAQISDLGEGGAFLDTPNPLAEGTELNYRFSLPGDPRPIEGRARVAWQQPMVGMGIEFLSAPEEHPRQVVAG